MDVDDIAAVLLYVATVGYLEDQLVSYVVRQSVLMPMGLNSMDFIAHILFIIPSFVNCLCH